MILELAEVIMAAVLVDALLCRRPWSISSSSAGPIWEAARERASANLRTQRYGQT
jgi:hypothetical protein